MFIDPKQITKPSSVGAECLRAPIENNKNITLLRSLKNSGMPRGYKHCAPNGALAAEFRGSARP